MFKLILYKELREIIASKKFAATFAIGSILIILAFFTGIKNYQAGLQKYNSSKAAQLQTFETITDWSRVASHRVFVPPNILESMVMGVSNDIGRTARVDGRSRPSLIDSTYSEQTVFAVFRFLDLEFVFQIILSLFAILFAFDAINGEKERGTLALSFSNAVPRASYIFGKIIGLFLALALPLLIPVLVGILLLPIMRVSLSIDEWIRFALFIVCGFLYLGIFQTLAVFMSCLTKYSSSSFLFLLIIWVFFVLIVPKASVLVAGNMIEVPPLSQIYLQKAQLEREISNDFTKQLREYFNELIQEEVKSGDKRPGARKRINEKLNEFMVAFTKVGDKKIQDLTSRLFEERQNMQSIQARLAFGISRISPSAVFKLSGTTLSGTSIELKNHLQEKAAAYSVSFAEFLRGKMEHKARQQMNVMDKKGKIGMKQFKPINPNEIPKFIYQSPELSDVLYEALPDIALLILFSLIFFCGAFLTFLRYDLR